MVEMRYYITLKRKEQPRPCTCFGTGVCANIMENSFERNDWAFMEKGSTGKRLLRETDYALMEQELLHGDDSLICLDADDLAVLRGGEAAFLWKSPLASSLEEMEELVQQAVWEMAPEPGQKILATVLHLVADAEWSLEATERIANLVYNRIANESMSFCFAVDFGDEGAHFTLYTAEGNVDEGESQP